MRASAARTSRASIPPTSAPMKVETIITKHGVSIAAFGILRRERKDSQAVNAGGRSPLSGCP